MKKWLRRLIPVMLACIVLAAVVSIGVGYYFFIAEQSYRDSERHLKEIYGQVGHSFNAFIDRNEGLLVSCDDYFVLAGQRQNADETIAAFVEGKKEYWEFSEFYFLDSEKNYITPAGETGSMQLVDGWDDLIRENTTIMAGEVLGGENVTVFAAAAESGTYRGFGFTAIAISYTNTDMAKALNADAFSEEGRCFVIRPDGSVLLSTGVGDGVFRNYLTYLKGAELGDEDYTKILGDLKDGKEGYLQCKLNDGAGVHCIVYMPVGYQGYFLLSDVPQKVVSLGFMTAQQATMRVLLILFSLMGVAVIAALLFRNFKISRKSRRELQYRERMFDVLSNTVDDIFIMLDSESQRVDYISPNVERLLGIPNKEVRADLRAMAKCAVDYNIIVPQEELEEIPLNGNKHWECEYMHQSTGERRWYRVTIYNMSIENTKKYVIVMSDRTLEQQMNQKLQEALDAAKSANEAKSNFLSNMSHDIRTPMNAIVGFSVLLEKDADKADKVREYTHKIMASGHHLLSLINDVLDMSKIESGKTSLNVDRFSLPELLENLNIILMPQAKAKEQEFIIHVQGNPPEQLMGDKLRLNQILINLLSNAIKYTPEKGKIEFLVCELPAAAPQYAKLRFVVKDNGIGMSEEFQKQVFAPFSREINSVTNKIQGTGLGMAITKNLVDLMGGIIFVKSKPNAGSTFTVEMSFALPEQEESDLWFRQKIARMLVADDEEDICLSIVEMMRDTGVDVSCVNDGASAVEAAVRAHKDGTPFDVILLDWKMPAMDGVETARRIRGRVGKDVPILVLTSYDWSEIEAEARAAGINAFMPKPFFTSTFFQTIKPLFSECAEEVQIAPADAAMKGKLFLVAEDNDLNAEILTEMLDMEGARCEIAVNGKEAVEMFEASEPDRYDMILMDVQMPIMNGYEATRTIRSGNHPRAKSIPIVAMTANTFAEDVRNALDSGMNGHLAKPIDMNAVRTLVGQLLGEQKDKKEQGERI